MNWETLRRIVTTNNEEGRSVLLIDGSAAKFIATGEAGLAEIWTSALNPSDLHKDGDKLTDANLKLEPDKGHVKVRWFTVAPEDGRTAEEKEAAAAFAFDMVGAAHARVDTSRHAMMHKTDTLDVIILVKGEVDLILDEGEPISLTSGDVVIQKATNHAWVNHQKETALLVAVLINAD